VDDVSRLRIGTFGDTVLVVALLPVTDQPGPMHGYDDLLAGLGMLDPAELRLRTAMQDQPVVYALCMALQAWNHVGHRDWRTREQVVAAARNMVAAGTAGPAEITDAAVTEALAAATSEPALIEGDESGRLRSATSNPEFGLFGVGLSRYLDTMRARANEPERLSPLEAVNAGREHHWHKPADLDAAQRCYQRAINSGDTDAVAFGEAGMADLAETRELADEADERHRRVFGLNHPEVSPESALWLAQRAYETGEPAVAAELTGQLVNGDADEGVLADAWSLRSVIHWAAGEHRQAVTAMTTAIEYAGPLAQRLWARLAKMHATMGDLPAAIEAQEHVLVAAFTEDDAIGVYLHLMNSAGRLPEAPARLQELAAADAAPLAAGRLHTGLASAYTMLGDEESAPAAAPLLAAHPASRTRGCRP
jgi:tetratricopeptide (TPR) repeat protein